MTGSFTCATLLCAAMLWIPSASAAEPTYAERLGWPEGTKAVIFHVDDAGMSHSSNRGTIRSMTEGVASSTSIMMPCPWVSEIAREYRERPTLDMGLHLTLTSEWKNYRWGPLAGKPAVPGLTDAEGCLWPSVAETVANASVEEVEREIRAQIERADSMGIDYTHLDSHMGTLFEPKFIETYVKIGIETQVPILLPGGHLQFIASNSSISDPDAVRMLAKRLWDAGLPVVDDICTDIYEWDEAVRVDKFIELLDTMKPGVLEVILHCTEPSNVFDQISGSGAKRLSDMQVMMDPRLREHIEKNGIVLTTWRELKERRDAVGDQPRP